MWQSEAYRQTTESIHRKLGVNVVSKTAIIVNRYTVMQIFIDTCVTFLVIYQQKGEKVCIYDQIRESFIMSYNIKRHSKQLKE